MSAINSLDVKVFLENAITEVFNTMLSMGIEWQGETSEAKAEGDRIAGSVSFAGQVMGNVSIQMESAFARLITASMLGMEPEEIEGEEEVQDVLGELCNMVGGDLKSRLCDAGLPCQLSIPSITTGKDFRVESLGWTRHELFEFRNGNHSAFVELCMKPGN